MRETVDKKILSLKKKLQNRQYTLSELRFLKTFFSFGESIKNELLQPILNAKENWKEQQLQNRKSFQKTERNYNTVISILKKVESIELRIPFHSIDFFIDKSKEEVDKSIGEIFLSPEEVEFVNNIYNDLKPDLTQASSEPSGNWENFEIGFGEKISRLKFYLQQKQFLLETEIMKTKIPFDKASSETLFHTQVEQFYKMYGKAIEYGKDIVENVDEINTVNDIVDRLLKLDFKQIVVKLKDGSYQHLFNSQEAEELELRVFNSFTDKQTDKVLFENELYAAYTRLKNKNSDIKVNLPNFIIGDIFLHNYQKVMYLSKQKYFQKNNIFFYKLMMSSLETEIKRTQMKRQEIVQLILDHPNTPDLTEKLETMVSELKKVLDKTVILRDKVIEIQAKYIQLNDKIIVLKQLNSELQTLENQFEEGVGDRMKNFNNRISEINKNIETSTSEGEISLYKTELLKHNHDFIDAKNENKNLKAAILEKKTTLLLEIENFRKDVSDLSAANIKLLEDANNIIGDFESFRTEIRVVNDALREDGYTELIDNLAIFPNKEKELPITDHITTLYRSVRFKTDRFLTALSSAKWNARLNRKEYLGSLQNLLNMEKQLIKYTPLTDTNPLTAKQNAAYYNLKNANILNSGEYSIEILGISALKDNYRFTTKGREYNNRINEYLDSLLEHEIINAEEVATLEKQLQNQEFDIDLDFENNYDFSSLEAKFQQSKTNAENAILGLKTKCEAKPEANIIYKNLQNAVDGKINLQNNKIAADKNLYETYRNLFDIIKQKRTYSDDIIRNNIRFIEENGLEFRSDINPFVPPSSPTDADAKPPANPEILPLEIQQQLDLRLEKLNSLNLEPKKNIKLTDLFDPIVYPAEETSGEVLQAEEPTEDLLPSCSGFTGGRRKRNAAPNCLEQIINTNEELSNDPDLHNYIKTVSEESLDTLHNTYTVDPVVKIGNKPTIIEKTEADIGKAEANTGKAAIANSFLGVYSNIVLGKNFLLQLKEGNIKGASETGTLMLSPIAAGVASNVAASYGFERTARVLPVVGNIPMAVLSVIDFKNAKTTEEKVESGINVGVSTGFVALDVLAIAGVETGPAGLVLALVAIGIGEGEKIYHAYVKMEDIVQDMNLKGYEKFQEMWELYWNNQNTQTVKNQIDFKEFHRQQLEFQLTELLKDPTFKTKFDRALLSLSPAVTTVYETKWTKKKVASMTFKNPDVTLATRTYYEELKNPAVQNFLTNQCPIFSIKGPDQTNILGYQTNNPYNGDLTSDITRDAERRVELAPTAFGRNYYDYRKTNLTLTGKVCNNDKAGKGIEISEVLLNPNNAKNVFGNYVGGQKLQKYESARSDKKGVVVLHFDTTDRVEVLTSAEELFVTTNATRGFVNNMSPNQNNVVIMGNDEKQEMKLNIVPSVSVLTNVKSNNGGDQSFSLIGITKVIGPSCPVSLQIRNSESSMRNLQVMEVRSSDSNINIEGRSSNPQVINIGNNSNITSSNPNVVFKFFKDCGTIKLNETSITESNKFGDIFLNENIKDLKITYKKNDLNIDIKIKIGQENEFLISRPFGNYLTLYLQKGMLKLLLPTSSKNIEENVWYDIREASYEISDTSTFKTKTDLENHLSEIKNEGFVINKYGNVNGTQIASFEGAKPIVVSNGISGKNDSFDFSSNSTSTIELLPKMGAKDQKRQFLNFTQGAEKKQNLILEGYPIGTIFLTNINQTAKTLQLKPIYFNGIEPAGFDEFKIKGPFFIPQNASEMEKLALMIEGADDLQPIDIQNFKQKALSIRYAGNYYNGNFERDVNANVHVIGGLVKVNENNNYNATKIVKAANNFIPIDLAKYSSGSAITFSDLSLNPLDSKNIEFVKVKQDGKYGILMHDKIHNLRFFFFNFENAIQDDNFEIQFQNGNALTMGDLRSLKNGLHKFFTTTNHAHSNFNSSISINIAQEKMNIYKPILPQYGNINITLVAGKVAHITVPNDAVVTSISQIDSSNNSDHKKDLAIELKYPNDIKQNVTLHGIVYTDSASPHHGFILQSANRNRTISAVKTTKNHYDQLKIASKANKDLSSDTRLFLEDSNEEKPNIINTNQQDLLPPEIPFEVQLNIQKNAFNEKAEVDIKRHEEGKQANKYNPFIWGGITSFIGGLIGGTMQIALERATQYRAIPFNVNDKNKINLHHLAWKSGIGAASGAGLGALGAVASNYYNSNFKFHIPQNELGTELWASDLLEVYADDFSISHPQNEQNLNASLDTPPPITSSGSSIHEGLINRLVKKLLHKTPSSTYVSDISRKEHNQTNIKPISDQLNRNSYRVQFTDKNGNSRVNAGLEIENSIALIQSTSENLEAKQSRVDVRIFQENKESSKTYSQFKRTNYKNGETEYTYSSDSPICNAPELRVYTEMGLPEGECLPPVDSAQDPTNKDFTRLQMNLNNNFNLEFWSSCTNAIKTRLLQKIVYTGNRWDVECALNIGIKTALGYASGMLSKQHYISEGVTLVANVLKNQFPDLDENIINVISQTVIYGTVYSGVLMNAGFAALPIILGSELGYKISNAILSNAPNPISFLPQNMQNAINRTLKVTDIAIEKIYDQSYEVVNNAILYMGKATHDLICKPKGDNLFEGNAKNLPDAKYWQYFGTETNNRANNFLQEARKIMPDKVEDLSQSLFAQAEILREARKHYLSENNEGFQNCLNRLKVCDEEIKNILDGKIKYKNFESIKERGHF